MKQEILQRISCSYENLSQKFIYKKKRKFDIQYAELYAIRSKIMKPKLILAAKNKWGNEIPIKPLVDVISNEDCIIIGTLFRKMELQPSILKEICAEENVLPLPIPEKYTSDDDILILEELLQRIQLTGDVSLPSALTGTFVANYGYETGGKFHVKEMCYSSIPKHKNLVLDQSLQNGEDRYILFLSGLGIGSEKENLLSLQLLIDLITGRISDREDQSIYSKICRVIIAGNALSKDTQDKETEKMAKYLSRNTQAKSLVSVKSLDDILVQLGSCVPVDIMPGEFDPSNQFLPQQPLHKCMLPNALSYSTVQNVTNPYQANICGLTVLGTSGQNVSNIYQFSGFGERLDILEATLNAGHLSPTSPDTLSCYPYDDDDPFIIEDCPDIYFAGNQPKFESREIKNKDGRSILLLLIPTFEENDMATLVNLRDLSCHPITIDTTLS